MKRQIGVLMLAVLAMAEPSQAQPRLLDDFEDLAGWQLIVSDGVAGKILSVPGHSGRALALDFEFQAGSGYAIAQKRMPLTLPENYKFTFSLRGETPVNNFEFKLLDSLDNVYWIKQLNLDYPRDWKKRTIKKRHITFAWGPAGGGMPRRIDRVEFVVSAGTGGKGRILVDDFKFEPIDDAAQPAGPPRVRASSSLSSSPPQITADGNVIHDWISAGAREHEQLTVDFQKVREIGGVVIYWDSSRFATAYDVELSDDGKEWTTAYAVRNGTGKKDYLYLPETEARLLRLQLKKSNDGRGYGLLRLEVKGAEFSASPNAFFTAIATAPDMPRGYFPRIFLQEQTYWTIVGASGDTKEALLSETGSLEVDKAGFSLEPFLYVDGRLHTWNEMARSQTLEQNYLPIPSVHWEGEKLRLTITAFAAGEAGGALLVARYHLHNKSSAAVPGKLFIALRPFQVLPPWQELNLVGGVARLDSLRYAGGVVHVRPRKQVFPLPPPTGFGAAEFDQGDITEYLQDGVLPASSAIGDHTGFASGALQYDFTLAPGEGKEVALVVPFHDGVASENWKIEELLQQTREFWQARLDNLTIRLPGAAQELVNTFKSQIAYILINRDGPAIQPGSRTYERAWIRDGSLTSTALLQTSHAAEVREYLDWYAPHQYPSGKVPCVVDSRGADPVPEHDSHGQLIYAVMEYYRFTHDREWLRGKFPHVIKAVRYIQELRRARMTEPYRSGTPEQRACFGLVPESISHEGYSAKPMHSYWDDFFVLRGLKDAAAMAAVLGEQELAREFAAERDDFRTCLYNSMRLAMANKKIDYIPGCVELGDFDATSTTIGVSLVNELGNIPEPQLRQTFDKYFQFFEQRRGNEIEWSNYTPYEHRLTGTFIHLYDRERAHALLDFFMADRRPPGWNHWAEVVWRDPATPKMIGDMPHTWVGSDFMRSLRSLFVFEREQDEALVIGEGIREQWVRDPAGVEVKNLPTHYGTLNYRMQMQDGRVIVDLTGDLRMPPGRLVVRSPLAAELEGVQVNGRKLESFTSRRIFLHTFPARLILRYAQSKSGS